MRDRTTERTDAELEKDPEHRAANPRGPRAGGAVHATYGRACRLIADSRTICSLWLTSQRNDQNNERQHIGLTSQVEPQEEVLEAC